VSLRTPLPVGRWRRVYLLHLKLLGRVGKNISDQRDSG